MASPEKETSPAGELLDRIEKFLEQDPKNPRLLVQAIDTALAQGNIAAARKHANTALDAHPGDPYMRHRHANVLLAEGRLDEAAVIFTYLWANHGDPNIAYNLGYVRFRQGNYDAAIKAVTPLTDATLSRSVALVLRALHHQGKLKEARETADSAMARHGADAEFLAAASLVVLDEGDVAKAEALAQKSLLSGARHIEALVAAGAAALARADANAAQAMFKQALAVSASDGRSLSGMGMAYLIAGDATNAKRYLERAAAQLPGHLDTLEALGWAQAMAGDLAQAEETFKQQLAKGDTDARRGLAVTYALQGRDDDANKALAHLKPNDAAAQMAKAIGEGGTQAAAQIAQIARRGTRKR